MCGRGCPWQGACMAGGHAWQGACVARGHAWQGHAWQGTCMAEGDMHGRGVSMAGGMCGRRSMCDKGLCMARGHVWQRGHACLERWPLQLTVRILLECILVLFEKLIANKAYTHIHPPTHTHTH